jgi:transcription-repair coupling factor (superfamily II helicase)
MSPRSKAGPKGAVVSFRDDRFANPEGLIAFIHKQGREAPAGPT